MACFAAFTGRDDNLDGIFFIWRAVRSIKGWRGPVHGRYVGVWVVLVMGGVVLVGFGRPVAGLIVLLLVQFIPHKKSV